MPHRSDTLRRYVEELEGERDEARAEVARLGSQAAEQARMIEGLHAEVATLRADLRLRPRQPGPDLSGVPRYPLWDVAPVPVAPLSTIRFDAYAGTVRLSGVPPSAAAEVDRPVAVTAPTKRESLLEID